MGTKTNVNIPRVAIMLLLVLVVIPLLPILITGKWDWWQAWVNAAIFSLGFIVSRALAARRTPDILRERANYDQHENTQPWDKWLSPLVAFGTVFILIVVAMDVRFHWSEGFPLGVQLIGLGLILAGYVLGSYAFVQNAYFSGTVRIREERGHRVISGGPYGWVRHPGYLGSVISNLGIPLLLGSLWGLAPVLGLTALFVLRTRLEDRFLQENLAGYREYAQKVRYRLLPGVW